MALSSDGFVVPTGDAPPAHLARWVRGTAVLTLSVSAPMVLVVGVLVAQGVQRPGTYDPVAQTVSTLAGRGATDRWFMAGTLFALGVIYLVVAAGLAAVPWTGRLALGLGAAAVICTSLAPQPAHGSSTVHMAGMVISCLAFVGWPLALAVDRGVDPALRRGSLAAAAVMLVALGWLCAQAWTDGPWLGSAERVLILTQTVWPIRVAAASWREGAGRGKGATATGPATLSLAVLAPVVFVVGLLAAQAAARAPDPLASSLSALAGRATPDRWIMTTTLGLSGMIYVLVAVGLRSLPRPPRLLLGLGGAMVLVVALAPQPVGGSSPLHMASAAVAWVAFGAWPLALACSTGVDVRLRWTSAVASGVLVVLLVWFAAQLVSDGTWYGVSQRVVFAAQGVWPIRVAVAMLRPAHGGGEAQRAAGAAEPRVVPGSGERAW